jgi:O-antigen/teichoic acid export membrane protein
MHLTARIALWTYIAFAIFGFVVFYLEGFNNFGPFAARENWISLLHGLAFAAGNAIVPTVLVMLGVWSNSWFKASIARRAERRFQKYSGNEEQQNGIRSQNN